LPPDPGYLNFQPRHLPLKFLRTLLVRILRKARKNKIDPSKLKDLLHLIENTFDRKCIYANPSSYPNPNSTSNPKTNPNPTLALTLTQTLTLTLTLTLNLTLKRNNVFELTK